MTISMIDQGLISAFNFAINLALIKWWSPEAFGVYSIVFTLSFALISFQNALINTPYAVLVPASKQPQALRHTLTISNLLFLVLIALACQLLQQLPLLQQSHSGATAITVFFVTRLLREYLRCRWAAELKLGHVLIVDALFVLLFGLACAGWAILYDWQTLRLSTLLWLMSLCQILGSAHLLWLEWHLLRQAQWRNLFSQYAPIWRQSRWSLVGVTTTELQNRGYIFVVGVLFGATVVGFINAGRVFFGPLNIVTSAWTRVAKPTLARLFGDNDTNRFYRILNQGLMAFILFNLLFSGLLWLMWPWVNQYLMADNYAGVGWVTAQWALATLVFHLRATASAAVQAQNRFKPLALTTLWGAGFATLALLIIGWLGQSEWVVLSVILGEAVALLLVFKLLWPIPTAFAKPEAKHG
ncbi:hypothetical protein [uncultured Ferrimonas sp.]|uniref:lipopolysaccharide biosynthesis protein n=1 Tax=uncultured Ferrimonas sp. TaxID=432640 RepID=UPI002623A889|nr:hypothetical protein [uncultured Ferrimonas sp.]